MQERIRNFLQGFDVRLKFFSHLNGTERILDIGCGVGGNGIALRKLHPSAEIHGVDLMPNADIPSFYSYKTVDLDAGILPYPDDYFDTVIFSNVIEHLHFPLRLGKEINRVMKSHATLYVETANWITVFIPSFGFHREQHNPFNFYDDHTHVKPWSKHGLYEFLLQSCNLSVQKVGTMRNWVRLPFDIPIFLIGLLTGRRSYMVSSVWNLTGWCIYGIGTKQ